MRLIAFLGNFILSDTYHNSLIINALQKLIGEISFSCPYYLENNTDLYGIVKHTQIFDDVYPHRTGAVSGIDPQNPLVFSDSSMPFDR